jgi:RNA polymerase sigma factor (sigma-70 family)
MESTGSSPVGKLSEPELESSSTRQWYCGQSEGREPLAPLEDLHQINRMVRVFVPSRSKVDQENLAMEIWLELWQKREPIRWMHVKNRCIDARKRFFVSRERSDVVVSDGQEIVNEGESPSGAEEIEIRDELNEIMACPRLDNRARSILWMRFYKNMSFGEIGSSTGLSAGEVKSEIARLCDELRTWSEQCSRED